MEHETRIKNILRRHRYLFAALAFLGLGPVRVLGAQEATSPWLPVPYSQLLEQADLVAVARVSRIAAGILDQGHTDCALMEVSEVLKGEVDSEDPVELIFPTRSPEAGSRSPLDLFFQEGMEGIWFLSRDPLSGRFLVDHPAQFKPLPLLPRVRAELDRM